MDAQHSQNIQEILQFWFGELGESATAIDSSKASVWFAGGNEFDSLLRDKYGSLVEAALRGELSEWEKEPRSRLALILLLDQFARNIYRGQAQAFAGDERALKLCVDGIQDKSDKSLRFIERNFYYMPLMHAESREMAKLCVESFKELTKEAVRAGAEGLPDSVPYALSHAEVVLKFGRYPHRNEVLGRKSTPEEERHLSQDGESWGQGK